MPPVRVANRRPCGEVRRAPPLLLKGVGQQSAETAVPSASAVRGVRCRALPDVGAMRPGRVAAPVSALSVISRNAVLPRPHDCRTEKGTATQAEPNGPSGPRVRPGTRLIWVPHAPSPLLSRPPGNPDRRFRTAARQVPSPPLPGNGQGECAPEGYKHRPRRTKRRAAATSPSSASGVRAARPIRSAGIP
jgi:hypothetical protein